MFLTVSNANQFNSYIQKNKFEHALRFLKENDVKFSYIDSQSVSCFDAIHKATFNHFTVHLPKLDKKDIDTLEKICIFLLEKEPHYWFKKAFNLQENIYYFFNFFLQQNNLEKVKFFTDNIKKFTNTEIEESYICYRSISSEMGELIRSSTENTKITIREISLAYSGFLSNHNVDSTEAFIDYLDDLIKNKDKRKLTYNHDDLVDFCLNLTKNKDFINIFPKIVELHTPELFKNHRKSESIDSQFPHLTSRLDFLAARIFSCMNFSRVFNGTKEKPVNKELTLPVLSYLQSINYKKNINDYVIGEFRYKFVPIALEFLLPSDSKDWPFNLGLSKEEGYKISSQYFSNFFVHLLSDSLVSTSTFSTEETKINRLTEYKKSYPEDFKKDLENFEEGLKALGLKQALNADINNIRLYFKMLISEENKINSSSNTVKIKKLKI